MQQNTFLLYFYFLGLYVSVSLYGCVFRLAEEFCNIFFCVPFDVLAGGFRLLLAALLADF